MKDYWVIKHLRIRTAKTEQTMVPNEFIDELMSGTNGEYVKVYLYILRHAGEEISEENVADALNLTCRDVGRAISYLEGIGVLEGIEDRQQPESKPDIVALESDGEFRALFTELKKYLSAEGKVPSQKDVDVLAYMYDTLKMPPEMIEYLLDACRLKHKASLRYAEKIALDWHSRGIRTVDEARKDTSLFTEEFGTVKSYLGLGSRALAPPETEYILKWLRKYRMPMNLIKEACSRTILQTGKATFSYADKILTEWKDKGVHSDDELKTLDDEHRASQEEIKKSAQGKKTKNGFHNFEERDKKIDEDILDKFNDLIK